jgi:RNA polymerase sigma-70 factor (ECF subfamily)
MPDDATLVERCLQGDAAAFDALVARYRDRVFSLAFRMLGEASAAEDAMQEAFLRAYTRLPLYDPAQPFATWLLCLTARVCLNARRDRATEQRYHGASRQSRPAHAPTLEERLYAREQRRTVQRLLMRLPAPQRAAMLLYYYEELPIAEVARALNTPEGTVKTWLYRGRESLRRWLEEELG